MQGIVEVWESEISQVDIVERTREGVRQGLTLNVIKSRLPLKAGKYGADSTQYANDLIKKMGKESRAYLDEPHCAIFVKLEHGKQRKNEVSY
jgi:hypothetical protein